MPVQCSNLPGELSSILGQIFSNAKKLIDPKDTFKGTYDSRIFIPITFIDLS